MPFVYETEEQIKNRVISSKDVLGIALEIETRLADLGDERSVKELYWMFQAILQRFGSGFEICSAIDFAISKFQKTKDTDWLAMAAKIFVDNFRQASTVRAMSQKRG